MFMGKVRERSSLGTLGIQDTEYRMQNTGYRMQGKDQLGHAHQRNSEVRQRSSLVTAFSPPALLHPSTTLRTGKVERGANECNTSRQNGSSLVAKR
jgi:hypothetical protein